MWTWKLIYQNQSKHVWKQKWSEWLQVTNAIYFENLEQVDGSLHFGRMNIKGGKINADISRQGNDGDISGLYTLPIVRNAILSK